MRVVHPDILRTCWTRGLHGLYDAVAWICHWTGAEEALVLVVLAHSSTKLVSKSVVLILHPVVGVHDCCVSLLLLVTRFQSEGVRQLQWIAERIAIKIDDLGRAARVF